MNRYSRNPVILPSHSNIFSLCLSLEKFSENIFETRIREAFTLSIFHVLSTIENTHSAHRERERGRESRCVGNQNWMQVCTRKIK